MSAPGDPSSSPFFFGGSLAVGAEHFARLVEEHYQPAYRFAFSLCGNYNDACDLTQQAFFIARSKGHQLRDATKGKQWLFTILHREFLATRRRTTSHPQSCLELVEHELPPISVDHAVSIDAKSALNALRELDENFRAPVALFYMEQLSYKQIAAVLEIPIGTVMSRLSRGKMMLRVLLEQRRDEPSDPAVAGRTTTSGGPSNG